MLQLVSAALGSLSALPCHVLIISDVCERVVALLLGRLLRSPYYGGIEPGTSCNNW